MLKILEPIPDHVAQCISLGIARSNEACAVHRENFAIVLGMDDEVFGGGVTASVSFAVLFINNLWVAEAHRRSGEGRRLMFAAEDEGRRRGAKIACVDTLSSQAPDFYAKLGYEEFARVRGENGGQPLHRIWLQKIL